MKKAILTNTTFGVRVFPDELRYSPVTDLYPGTITIELEGEPQEIPMNLIDIDFQIFARHYERTVVVTDPETEEASDQLVQVPFGAPVLFDTGQRSIPYALYLLIESYRDQPTPEKLAMINAQVAQIPFENSLEGFVLNVVSLV